MIMNKRMLTTLLSISLSTALLFGCATQKNQEGAATSSDNQTQNDLTKITLNEVAHSIFYAPMYVSIEKGYFEDEGIHLDLICGFGADKVMAAVLSGETDIGFMGSEASIYTYNEGANDYIVNFAQLTQRAGNFLVARKKMPDFSWADIKNSTVLGGRTGGMPQMVFEYILKQNGIDPSRDVQINQNIDFGSTAAAFSEGQADFTVEFEPGATLLESEEKGHVVASLGEDSGYVPYTAFCAKQSFIDKNPDLLQRFVNALQKGVEYVQSHRPEEIAKTIQPQFPETTLDTITTMIARYYNQETWKDNLIFEEGSFNLLQDILDSAGELDSRPPYNDLINTSFAENSCK